MTLPYSIKDYRKNTDDFTFNLDTNMYVTVPPHFFLGIVKQHKRISNIVKYFSKCFTSEDPKDQGFRHTVAFIHGKAKEHKGLMLQSKSAIKDIHIEAFTRFMESENEIIEIMYSYMNQGMPVTKDAAEQPRETEQVARNIGDPELDKFQLKGTGVDRLTDDDIRQIKTLMMNGSMVDAGIEDGVTDVVAKGLNND